MQHGRPHVPRSGASAASIMVAVCRRTDYQLQLSQTPVKDMAWLHVGQTSPILPSFMLERASFGDSARAAIIWMLDGARHGGHSTVRIAS